MKKIVLLAAALGLSVLAGAGSLRADETLRRAQQALRDQGFYYGPIDGSMGDETTQALRRYQIRNGLAVSGQLTGDTLRSLKINAPPPAPSSPRSEPTPPPLSTPVPPVLSGRSGGANANPPPPARATPPPPYSRPELRASPPSPPSSDDAPQEPRAVLPPGAQLPSNTLTEFFTTTPFEFAPPAVQADVLRRAQRLLGREGFYNGAPDGAPGPMTVRALGEFQGTVGLRRTARLDTPTLRAMRLLPGRGFAQPPVGRSKPAEDEFDDDDDEPPVRQPRRGRAPFIYEGRIAPPE